MDRNVFLVACLCATSLVAPFLGVAAGERTPHRTHVNEIHTLPVGVYAEQIYQSARQRSDELRATLGTQESTIVTDLQGGDMQRVWDLFYPDYNCPFGKERVGRIGEITSFASQI